VAISNSATSKFCYFKHVCSSRGLHRFAYIELQGCSCWWAQARHMAGHVSVRTVMLHVSVSPALRLSVRPAAE